MKIALIRHFRVKKNYDLWKWITPSEMMQWFDEYDQADVEETEVDLGEVDWEFCLSSDLPRAVKTAKSIYAGDVVQLPQLREVPFFPLTKREIRLPFWFWGMVVRLAWKWNHRSQIQNKEVIQKRIEEVLSYIEKHNKQNVLIVGHGALMMFMQKELFKRGFQGPTIRNPVNAKLYVYTK